MIATAATRTDESVVDLLARLRAYQGTAGVLTVYLGSPLARDVGGTAVPALRDRIGAIRQQLKDAGGEGQRLFEDAVARVEKRLERLPSPIAVGLVIVALPNETGVHIAEAPGPTADRVVWSDRPALDPLLAAIDDHDRFAVVLFDKERARIFTVFLGKIEERHLLHDDVPGKQATGGWFGLSQKRYARHHEHEVTRHADRTIRAVIDDLRATPFERLIVGGPDEAVTLLKERLPRPLTSRLAGEIRVELFAPDAEVLEAALAVADQARLADEVDEVRRLIDRSGSGRAVLGVENTLAALGERRVHRLVVAAGLRRDGARCPACWRLTIWPGRCPRCAGRTEEVDNLREATIWDALDQDAQVGIVSGRADDLLMEHGGLGAWTRY